MKRSYALLLVLGFSLSLISVCYAQRINYDSLKRVAFSIRDSTAASLKNPDSLLKTVFLLKTEAERISRLNDVVEQYLLHPKLWRSQGEFYQLILDETR